METLKLLIVDDHLMIRNGVKLILSNSNQYQFDLVEVSSGADAMNHLKSSDFDLVILDISLSDISGLDVLKFMKNEGIQIPVLVQSMHKEIDIIRQTFELDAKGYLLKSSEQDELLKAITEIIQGGRFLSHEISLIFSSEVSKNMSATAKTTLSLRQIEILKSIARGKTNEELAEIYSLSKRTIEGHRSKIMKKLQLKTTSDLVRYVYENKL